MNSAGIHVREIPGIEGLAEAFPDHWLLYASFQCMPKASPPIEIDAMVVMDDRVLLLEIKDWNGDLTVNGDQWLVNGRSRGRSPVDSVNMKAKKVASFLGQTIPNWSMRYFVDSRVVLTGSSTKAKLPLHEQRYVLNLVDARSLADPAARSRLLDTATLLAKRPWQFETDFERVTRNARLFGPLETQWNGFRVVEENVVQHPSGLWREHRAERVRDPRIKALVRIWAFDKLKAGLNTPEHRRFIAEREGRALARLEALNSSLIQGGVLMPIHEEKDEILTQHYELRRLPAGWTTLDRFLERSRDDLTLEDRALAAAKLLNAVGELHVHGIAHRDLGQRSVWINGVTSQALTGFMACQMPDEGSVSEWLDALRCNGAQAATSLSARQQDVESAARLALQILNGVAPDDVASSIKSIPAALVNLQPWFERAFLSDPEKAFESGRDAADEFGRILDVDEAGRIDQAVLDRHETAEVPYVRWMPIETLHQSASKHVYRSVDAETKKPLIVKIWFGWRRGLSLASDLALMRLFGGVARIRDADRPDLPKFFGAGLSGAGAFVVYAEAQGCLWSQMAVTGALELLRLGIALVRAVEALHAMDLSHGDLSARNIVVSDDGASIVLIDLFDFSGVGDGFVRAGDMRPVNAERLSALEIDRYAVVRLIEEALSAHENSELSDVMACVRSELRRDKIELLQPVAIQLQNAERRFETTSRRTIRVFVAGEVAAPLLPAGSPLFARAFEQSEDTIEYIVSGVERELAIKVKSGIVGAARVSSTKFKSLSNASEHGTPVEIDILVDDDERQGTQALYEFLKTSVAVVPLVRPPANARTRQRRPSSVVSSARLDVGRYWRRLLELEEEHQPAVRILKIHHSVGDIATYAYERLGADFDFDPDEQVEVRMAGGPRVGELDLSQTDGQMLVVRHPSGRRLLPGHRVILTERRARSSFDRRSKAVERVLENEAGVKGLIDYFTPDKEVMAVDYGTVVDDDDLAPYGLNDGQKAAFRHVARFGPVALQQGPPGTGKTRFIAAFVHWLVTKRGARKVLIASQSHEAVNNAIEAIVDLYKKIGAPRPSLLRIGSKGVTEKIRPFHTQALRERYQVRFDTAFKHRVVGLASALGMKRAFVQDAVDLDQNLGGPARRLTATVLANLSEQDSLTADERRRNDRSHAIAEKAFQAAVRSVLGDGSDQISVEQASSTAFERLAQRYPGTSASDIRQVRHVIDLARDWAASLTSSHRNFEEFLAKTRTVVTATCVGVGQTKIRIDASNFDWVIIDEAARCTASELAVPVQVGQRILLVGDHLQLKPMIERSVLRALEEDMAGVPSEELERSDFERAYTSTYGRTNGRTFTEQYRMAPAICELVSSIFYEPNSVQLKTSSSRISNAAFSDLARPLDMPVVWLDTSAAPEHEERPAEWDSHTFWNPAEVETTMRILERIAGHVDLVAALAKGAEETPIGIICMYSGQKIMIEQAFSDRSWDARFRRLVRIETVDSYQGKENTVVIMSLVRSNPWLLRGHVASFNRCNVALSRAKERLFIVGARSMWSAISDQEPMKQVLDYLVANKPGTRIVGSGEFA